MNENIPSQNFPNQNMSINPMNQNMPEHPSRKRNLVILASSLIGVAVLVIILALVFTGAFNTSNQEDAQKEDNNQSILNQEDRESFPLGTGKYSFSGPIFSGPMKGAPYFCQSLKKVFQTKIGAHVAGPWIDEKNGVWYPELRAVVDGENYWPDAYAKFTVVGNIRKVEINNLPVGDPTGNFPVAKNDDAYNYDRNPNYVEAKSIVWEIPRYPEIAKAASCVPLQTVGYALNGIPLFSAADGQGRDPAYEVSDACQGHPGPIHVYHYHIVAGNECIEIAESQSPEKETKLIGYILDGFGIYSQYENGKELFTSDLDECHGHISKVLFDGVEKEMYHYHVTRDYPYTISCFKGTQIDSAVNSKARGMLNMPPIGL